MKLFLYTVVGQYSTVQYSDGTVLTQIQLYRGWKHLADLVRSIASLREGIKLEKNKMIGNLHSIPRSGGF